MDIGLFDQSVVVRLYRINWSTKDSFNEVLDKDQKLNKERIPLEGIELSRKQIDILREALIGKHDSALSAPCFYPHHALYLKNQIK